MKKIIFIASVILSLGVFSNVSIARENIICFPNGQCIDVSDPGIHP